jgi:hypothetical protein
MENNLYNESEDYVIIKDYNNKIIHIQFSKDKFIKTKYKFKSKKSRNEYWDNMWFNNADEYAIRDFDCNLQKLHILSSYRFLCHNISLIFVAYIFFSFATKNSDFHTYFFMGIATFFYALYYVLKKYFEYYANNVFFTKDLLTPDYIRECNKLAEQIENEKS